MPSPKETVGSGPWLNPTVSTMGTLLAPTGTSGAISVLFLASVAWAPIGVWYVFAYMALKTAAWKSCSGCGSSEVGVPTQGSWACLVVCGMAIAVICIWNVCATWPAQLMGTLLIWMSDTV